MSESTGQPPPEPDDVVGQESPSPSWANFMQNHCLSLSELRFATPTDYDTTESIDPNLVDGLEPSQRSQTPTDLDTTETVTNSYESNGVRTPDVVSGRTTYSEQSLSMVDDSVEDPDFEPNSDKPRKRYKNLNNLERTRTISDISVTHSDNNNMSVMDNKSNHSLSIFDMQRHQLDDASSCMHYAESQNTRDSERTRTLSDMDKSNEDNDTITGELYENFQVSIQELARSSTPVEKYTEPQNSESILEVQPVVIIPEDIEPQNSESILEVQPVVIIPEDTEPQNSESILEVQPVVIIPEDIEPQNIEPIQEVQPVVIIPQNLEPILEDEPVAIILEEGNQNLSKSQKREARKAGKKAEIQEKNKRKHPIRPSVCKDCPNKCNDKFNETDRQNIWNIYWSLEYSARRKWLASLIKSAPIRRRRVSISGDTYRKTESRTYFLRGHEEEKQVCLSFLLKTLGYSSDSVIKETVKAIKKGPLFSKVKENRGGRKSAKTCNKLLIKAHINSYNPCVAHYRRHNAPNARYMPMGLALKDIYNDFVSKHPGVCSKETYRKTLIDEGISLHTPENDVCGECAYFKKIKADCQAQGEEISDDIKQKCEEHETKSKEAKEQYTKDKELEEGRTLKVFSMDLEKVILIPIMPKIKDTFFVSRLVVFNETFASLKPGQRNYCCMWHEAIAGRDAPQIIDAILAFLREERDTENFILWCDNCCSQNKNWFLFTALVTFVNSNIASQFLQSVTIKYLTKGHTHMTADAIHGNIEQALKKKGDTYDYQDLLDTIRGARRNLQVVEVDDFHKWPKKRRQPRRGDDNLRDLKLRDIVEAKFTRGSRKMKFKTSFRDEEYEEINFLQARFDETSEPQKEDTPRGIDSTKKNMILTKLVRSMPRNRESFWRELPVKENAVDLIVGGQYIDRDDE